MKLEEKYQSGYRTYDQAVIEARSFTDHIGENMDEDTPVEWWAARSAARKVTSEMAAWIRVTFDLTDEQKKELHSLMCHVGSD